MPQSPKPGKLLGLCLQLEEKLLPKGVFLGTIRRGGSECPRPYEGQSLQRVAQKLEH
jgi:hypothetical protein